jgi:hypothetical protein
LTFSVNLSILDYVSKESHNTVHLAVADSKPQPKPNPIVSPWLKKHEYAKYRRCSVRHITDLMNERKIPFHKDGRELLFNIHKCDRAMEKFEVKSVEQYSQN